jgi:site-specific DNA recombinase
VLTHTTYVGRHRFNTKFWKTRERKPEAEVVEMAVPPIVEAAEFEAVQALLRTRHPAFTAPRITSGATLLTGICFCAGCGRAMTLRTGKSGRYRYYTCSTKARQGETGCQGRTVPMENSTRWLLISGVFCSRRASRKSSPRCSTVVASAPSARWRTRIAQAGVRDRRQAQAALRRDRKRRC